MRSTVAVALCTVAVAACGVWAHICMIFPPQRSSFSIATPGSDACYRKVGPCGNNTYDPNGEYELLTAGTVVSVQFQQNLNHFYTQHPGLLDVSVAYTTNPKESDFQPVGSPIADYNAMNMITQTNFSVPFTVPNTLGRAVVRARYVSNNPLENDRGEIFYQCADVQIVAPLPPAHTHAHAHAPAHAQVPAQAPRKEQGDAVAQQPQQPQQPQQYHFPVMPYGKRVEGAAMPAAPCCSASGFSMSGFETGSWRAPTQVQVFFDADNALMRVDTETGAGSGATIYDGSFVMYLNFTSGIEYYLNVNTNQCVPYGLDYWNSWCFGGYNETETFTQQLLIGDMAVNEWANGPFLFGSSADDCTPVFQGRTDTGAFTLWTDFEPVAPVPSVFQPPANCHLALHDLQQQGRVLAPTPNAHLHAYGHPALARRALRARP